MDIINIIILLASGVIVGFINTLAGGGTIISISTFMYMGLPLIVAAGTNRIPIIMQNIVAVSIFRRKRMYTRKDVISVAIPLMLGAIISAQFSTMVSEKLFTYIFIAGLILFSSTLFFNPKAWEREERDDNMVIKKRDYILIFLIGIYGGSVYVGLGYMLLTIFVLSLGYDLIRANALKNLMALILAPLSIIPFILSDNVNYEMGIVHGLGNIIGAFLGTKFAISLGPKFVRILLLAIVICSIVYYIIKLFN